MSIRNLINSSTDMVTNLSEDLLKLCNSSDSSRVIEDMRSAVQALIQSNLKQLDIVSKEEFEAQAAVLARSREKIDQLEQQLAELAAQLEKS